MLDMAADCLMQKKISGCIVCWKEYECINLTYMQRYEYDCNMYILHFHPKMLCSEIVLKQSQVITLHAGMQSSN